MVTKVAVVGVVILFVSFANIVEVGFGVVVVGLGVVLAGAAILADAVAVTAFHSIAEESRAGPKRLPWPRGKRKVE